MMRAVNEGAHHEAEYRVNARDGSQHWLHCSADPQRNRDGQIEKLVGMVQDITLHKQRLEELTRARTEAERANQVKDEFLANMSHELRTPLTSIIGNSNYLLQDLADNKQQEILHSIRMAGENQLALVNDILDMSKIESGKFAISNTPFDLDRMLAELQQLLVLKARDNGIELHFQAREPQRYRLMGDEQRLRQVLINLIGNAIKFTPEGEVNVSTRVESDLLIFSVEDSGIGMSPELMERLFNRFEQADGSISRRFGGSGLGLYISLHLARLMGGTIDASSREGEGSVFELRIPCHYSEQRVVVDVEEPAKVVPSEKRTLQGHVLVAEDTPMLQQLEKRMLEKMGLRVTLAANGVEALEAAAREPFDLILMDMQMPEMDGIEATQRLREQGNQTPVVVLTANVMQKHRDAFEAAGCNGFLGKPIEEEHLRETVAQYVASVVDESAVEAEPVEQGEHSSTVAAAVASSQDAPETPHVDESLRELFRERVHELRLELSEALLKEDWEAVHDAAHVIKGSGTSFGYQGLTDLATVVCDAIDHGHTEGLQESVMELIFKTSLVL